MTVIDDDLTLSNGLAWSPDGSVLYSVDTTPGIVYARPYNAVSGAWGERAVALRIANGGSPDGLCIDAAGNLWIAIWGAGQVRCYTPGGELVAAVEVPAPHVTSVAFVGPELDTLLITSAREDDSPSAGHLFTTRIPGVTRPADDAVGRARRDEGARPHRPRGVLGAGRRAAARPAR